MHQAGVPCLEVFIAKGQDGQLRQQASVLRAATPPADEAQPSSNIGEAFAAGVGLPELPMGLRISKGCSVGVLFCGSLPAATLRLLWQVCVLA